MWREEKPASLEARSCPFPEQLRIVSLQHEAFLDAVGRTVYLSEPLVHFALRWPASREL